MQLGRGFILLVIGVREGTTRQDEGRAKAGQLRRC